MSRLETFDQKRTTWEGLWYHPETHGFTSSVINLSKLKQFKGNVRVYMRKNRFYNDGENGRPNYVFSIMDADSDRFSEVDVVGKEEKMAFTYADLQRLINQVAYAAAEWVGCDGDTAYGELIVSDFIDWGNKEMLR